jgi:hypothetical protein
MSSPHYPKSRQARPSAKKAAPLAAPKGSRWLRYFRRRYGELWAYVLVVGSVFGGIAWHMLDEALVNIIVRVQPGRKECLRWVEHLRAAGYRVWVEEERDPIATRRQQRVPDQLAACHTAMWVQGHRYVIEGHVPADLIARMIAEHAAIRGIAVPGTPAGAPGLEGPDAKPYDVWAFTSEGQVMRFAHRDPPAAAYATPETKKN